MIGVVGVLMCFPVTLLGSAEVSHARFKIFVMI